MATLVNGGALSHSPLLKIDPFPEEKELLEQFCQSAAELGRQILASKPDVVVVIGQDHLRSLFYDLMPAITIGTGRLGGWGDWGSRSGELAAAPELARHIHRHLLSHGMDPACSYDLKLDHGVCQALDSLGVPAAIPVVPILINCLAPPLPSPERGYRLGVLLREAIQAFPCSDRVAVICSGGLSHSPPSGDVEAVDEEARPKVQQLIHGRADVEKNEEARERRLVEMVRKGVFRGTINPEWDRLLLASFEEGKGEELAQELTLECIAA